MYICIYSVHTLTWMKKIGKINHRGHETSVFYHLSLNIPEFCLKTLILFQLFLEQSSCIEILL